MVRARVRRWGVNELIRRVKMVDLDAAALLEEFRKTQPYLNLRGGEEEEEIHNVNSIMSWGATPQGHSYWQHIDSLVRKDHRSTLGGKVSNKPNCEECSRGGCDGCYHQSYKRGPLKG